MSLFNLKAEPQPTDRAAIVEIPMSLISRLLMLPEGIESTRVSYDINSDKLRVMLEGEELPKVYLVRTDGNIPRATVHLKSTKATTYDGREIWATEFDGIY